MGRFNWGPDGPPDEAYSRVTEPERFLPLVDWTLDLLNRLEAEYDVVREEGYGIDPELERAAAMRPTVRLAPRSDAAAPIVAAFINREHAGVHVRFGRWHTEPFPDCGCDACDETAEDGLDSLREVVGAVVAGQFREWFRLQPDGSGKIGRDFWSPDLQRQGWSRVEPYAVWRFSGGNDWVLNWQPWPRKPHSRDAEFSGSPHHTAEGPVEAR